MDRSRSIQILFMTWLFTIVSAKTMLTLGLDIQITKATSMADTNGLLLAWTTCLTGNERVAISTMPLKAVQILPMLLPKRKLEKEKALGTARGIRRTAISG